MAVDERGDGRVTLDLVGSARPIEDEQVAFAPVATPAQAPAVPAPGGPGSGRLGLVLLVTGLGGMLAVLALQATSVAQAVALAIPVALVGAGLERIGRRAAVAGLRPLGVLLLLAVTGPVLVAATPPASMDRVTVGGAVPPGTTEGVLRVGMGSGQLQLGSGGPGLFEADLRSAGAPRAG